MERYLVFIYILLLPWCLYNQYGLCGKDLDVLLNFPQENQICSSEILGFHRILMQHIVIELHIQDVNTLST